MAVISNGMRLQKGKGRPTLSPLDPFTETLLAGLGISKESIHHIRAFAKHWQRERNRWDIDRRKGGMFSVGRMSKRDADAALKRELAALEGGDA